MFHSIYYFLFVILTWFIYHISKTLAYDENVADNNRATFRNLTSQTQVTDFEQWYVPWSR
jgi:hypothetical protein